ncbi:MAG: uncharacterized protein QOI56_1672 [Actinomycetota bacterium]|nr:uncharacterized protein [Actinomycetota bacterium]
MTAAEPDGRPETVSPTARPTGRARHVPSVVFVLKLDRTHRVDVTHDSRSDMTGSSTQGIKTVLHPVSDLAAAKAVYEALLGVAPQTDSSYYVGFEAEGQHIGLVPGGGPQAMTSPVAYWHVADIEAKLAEVTAAGATVKEPAHDVGGGRLVATFTDPDGNVLGLLQDR